MSQCPVSIIIPIYNQEKYLAECLDSARAQNMNDIEILCIDDGSTDSSLQIANSYMMRDSRVNVLTQENKGVSQTRNRGIRCAKGDYVIFCDPDDFYPSSTTIRTLYEAASNNEAHIAGGSFSRYNNQTGTLTTQFDGMYAGYTFSKPGFMQYADYQFDYGFHRFLFQRDFLLENDLYFPDYKRFQDPPFLVATLNAASSFYALPDIVYRYRKNHTTVKWTAKKAVDLSQGILDILIFSAENDLWNLHALTVNRIDIEHRKVLADYAENIHVLKLLIEMNASTHWEKITDKRISGNAAPNELLLPLSDVLNRLSSSRAERYEQVLQSVESQKNMKRRLKGIYRRLRNMLAH